MDFASLGGGGGGGGESHYLSTTLGPTGTWTGGNLSSGNGSSQGGASSSSWLPLAVVGGIGLVVVLFALRK